MHVRGYMGPGGDCRAGRSTVRAHGCWHTQRPPLLPLAGLVTGQNAEPAALFQHLGQDSLGPRQLLMSAPSLGVLELPLEQAAEDRTAAEVTQGCLRAGALSLVPEENAQRISKSEGSAGGGASSDTRVAWRPRGHLCSQLPQSPYLENVKDGGPRRLAGSQGRAGWGTGCLPGVPTPPRLGKSGPAPAV